MRRWFASSLPRALRIVRMPGPDRRLLIEATFWLGFARACVLALPYRHVISLFSLEDRAYGSMPSAEQHRTIAHVLWAVTTASRHTPWASNCLARAIAGKVMLRRRQVASTLYLGLRKETEALVAHAWLDHGRSNPLGDEGRSDYTIVWSSGEEG